MIKYLFLIMRTIFVSSTSEDLQPFRQAAKEVILDLGFHPVMMEHFGTDSMSGTVDACKKRVAEADFVLAIIGWRLGWVPGLDVGGDGKKSITQIEIDTAKTLSKPLCFLLADDFWPGKLWEDAPQTRKQIQSLRDAIDRLAVFFAWEVVVGSARETLPQFRAKVRQELLRTSQADQASAPFPNPTPSYLNEEIRLLSEALSQAHEREREIVTTGGDPNVVREEILDLRRKLREGGRLKAGDILGSRFQLINLLGKGGFATVWKAFDLNRHKLVAVKVLHGQYAEDRTRLERFFRGARKMAELHHQGIVHVFEEQIDEGGFHFFVMEFVEGGDLRQAILGKILSYEKVTTLLRQVANALSFAHNRGVIHRDVKPANILLAPYGFPKLTDFDLVQAADSTGGTRTGAVLGTFLYASPECLSVPQSAGISADVYSFAMTAAFCFHGQDLTYDVLRRSDAFFDQLPCPEGVRAALRRGAAWEASERFQSIADLSEAIEIGFANPAGSNPSKTSLLQSKSRGQRIRSSPSSYLISYLEKEITAVPPAGRPGAVLAAIGHALPIDADDLTTLGITAWALDYFPARSEKPHEREEALYLRAKTFEALHQYHPLPALPNDEEPGWTAIPSGTFSIGSNRGEGESDERPKHRVRTFAFRLGIYPVTVAEYAQFAGSNAVETNLPATGMDWYSAYAYAAWRGGRLPTEAEWEVAARGGTLHPYSDRNGQSTTLDTVGWYEANAGHQIQPVGGLEPNPWGLYDMIGNIWEWVADWHGRYLDSDLQTDPWGPPIGSHRVLRGGSARFRREWARAAVRLIWDPKTGGGDKGFRIALPADPAAF